MEYLEERGKIRVEPEILESLHQLSGSKVYLLDMKASKKGEVSKKWRIINNAGYIEV
jgi:hypothetical protein